MPSFVGSIICEISQASHSEAVLKISNIWIYVCLQLTKNIKNSYICGVWALIKLNYIIHKISCNNICHTENISTSIKYDMCGMEFELLFNYVNLK